jgi:hypothetical protein
MAFGANGRIVYPIDVYPALKKAFDLMHQSDEHVLTLRQAPSGASK